ncbi:MAG: Gfo/Idh/MocA family oxidoreductase [Kiritimatiellae bacterium]|nr:Gfo/Idh/MocA family oxidoreductase [Kiritimatiellia bacterium]
MDLTRRGFMGAGAAFFAAAATAADGKNQGGKAPVQGFDEIEGGCDRTKTWQPFSDRKVRVGIAGYGVCQFGAAFGYQNHPNCEVVSCTDLDPERCKALQKAVGAPKTYPSCEELIKHAAEDKVEALYVATDAASHVRLCIMALEHGLHVTTAVPALLGKDQLEFVPKLLDAVKRSGKVYQMNETTAFRPQTFEMRALYEAGALGEIAYTEGEYFHFGIGKKGGGIGSYKGWRVGLPPQYYPTHSNGFYTCVTHKRFTEVSCVGLPSTQECYAAGNNPYGNRFGHEVAFFKCETGASARMTVAWDLPGYGGELGRCFGQLGCYRNDRYVGDNNLAKGVQRLRLPLPPGVPGGGHGGSHGYLTDDFLRAIILKDHKPCVDVITALDTTVSGVYAHMSAEKGGETLKIPEFSL